MKTIADFKYALDIQLMRAAEDNLFLQLCDDTLKDSLKQSVGAYIDTLKNSGSISNGGCTGVGYFTEGISTKDRSGQNKHYATAHYSNGSTQIKKQNICWRRAKKKLSYWVLSQVGKVLVDLKIQPMLPVEYISLTVLLDDEGKINAA
jgi:hypothetical protein